MRKFRFLSALMAAILSLLLLTACQTVPTDDPILASVPSSVSLTPPAYSTRPSTSTPSTSVPTTSTPAVDVHDGLAFIYHGPQFVVLSPYWRPSEALVNHLYWVVISTKEYTLICDEPVIAYTTTDTHVYFVKESESTKIYRTPIGDFANHQLFYESDYGKVTYMTFISQIGWLEFVADEKKFVSLDMTTKECTVLMEQYYIEHAYLETIPHQEELELREWIWFYGKPTEDAPQGDYFYYWETGEVEEDTSL